MEDRAEEDGVQENGRADGISSKPHTSPSSSLRVLQCLYEHLNSSYLEFALC